MKKLGKCTFEIGPIRPPSEGGSYSLLIRATRNCPWNRCKFCYGMPYNHERFQLRPVEEIKTDIRTAKTISDEIKQVSWQLGYAGQINNAVASYIIQREPYLNESHSFISVYNWLSSGERTVFLQDADSLIMKTPDLVEVIKYLKETFPSLERITSYARAKTVYHKTLEELKDIKTAGLNRVHVGLETGDDELLEYIDKGVTAEQHIIAGRKAKEAGLEYSAYIMPGLGGCAKSEQHAKNTARVLNEINPQYIRLRPFVPKPNTPLFDEYQRGEFQISSPHERLRELEIMIGALTVTSRLCFDHMMNGWRKESGGLLFTQDYEGYKFPEEKDKVLGLIKEGLKVTETKHIDARVMMAIPHL
jgi:radical SAM superfamily enzyme YgiQ (UPF0313 family)